MSFNDKMVLFKRWFCILTGKNRVAVKQGIGKYYKIGEIAGYYNDLTLKVNNNTMLDDDGIPVNEIAGGQKVYFPISIFQYALALWDLYLENGEEAYANHFLKLCDWIYLHQQKDGSWDCFSPIGYKTQSVSSMGQGEAISVLIRAYKLTSDKKWLESAHKAASFMCIPITEGGVLRYHGEEIFLEEYPGGNGEKLTVLNGWIFSVFGLYDYLLTVQDDRVEAIMNKTVISMKNNLEKYDMGYWSYYDQTGRIASPAYHQLHIALLKAMGDITGMEEFYFYSGKWKQYEDNRINRLRAVIKKIYQKMNDNPEGVLVK